VRTAHGYTVDAPGGLLGHVAEVRVGPYEFWPEALIIETAAGGRLRVPVTAVARAFPRERRLLLHEAPVGADVIPYPPLRWHERDRTLRFAGAVGFSVGVAGYAATFALLALGVLVEAALILAAAGAIGAVASAFALKAGRRTQPVMAGLTSALLPLVVGVILSLVRILG
jgi:hypothetical protein